MQTPTVLPPELKRPTALERARYRHEPDVADRIVIPDDVSGLVGTRQWHLQPGMYITSLIHLHTYASSVIWADAIPTAWNRNGIYAHRLPFFVDDLLPSIVDTVTGLVELGGHVVVHEDGVLRGERCRILMLIAHGEFAARLSRIYGVPVIAADRPGQFDRRLKAWLCTHEGVTILKHNVDLISDMQARRLLKQVEGLDEGTVEAESPEDQKDRGERMPVAQAPKCTPCGKFTLIVRNAALERESPGGWRAFANKYRCRYNSEISVLQAIVVKLLNKPLREMLLSGLRDEEDYILIEPGYDGLGLPISYRIKQAGAGESTLRMDWLKTEVEWLNANLDGAYRWRA